MILWNLLFSTSCKRSGIGLLAVMVVLPAFGGSPYGEDSAEAAFGRFDQAVEAIALEGTPPERAEAVVALALVRSPRFGIVRDALAADPHKEVRVALHRAIQEYRDHSPEASAILTAGLQVPDRMVAWTAGSAMFQLDLHVPFDALWCPDEAPSLFATEVASKYFYFGLLDGVAASTPWRDPAWSQIPWKLQCRILARAGSWESIDLLVETIRKGGDLASERLALPVAEPVNPTAIRRLLAHPRKEVRAFASLSLVQAKDELHISEILKRIAAAKNLPAAEQRARLAGLAIDAVIVDGDPEALRVALDLKFGGYGYRAAWMRSQKSPSEAFADLKSRYDRLPSAPPFSSSERGSGSVEEEERNAYEQRNLLLRALVEAMVRERRYEELPALIRRLLRVGDFRSLHLLQAALTPGFLLGLPDPIAADCVTAIRAALKTRRHSGGVYSNGERQETAPMFQLLGALARGEEADELWFSFRTEPNGLQSYEEFMPIAWGFSRRCEELRRELVKVWGRSWFHVAYMTGDFLSGYKIPPRDACPGTWNPLKIVASWASLGAALRELSLALEVSFPSRNEGAFRSALASIRGSKATTSNPPGHLTGPESRPGPPLAPEDRVWLSGVIRKMREEAFQAHIRHRTAPFGALADGPPAPTRDLVSSPSGIFLDAGIGFLEEVRELLTSTDRINRHEAAWALWMWFRDTKALHVMLADAEAEDSLVRASALNMLRLIRYRPVAALFPEQLGAAAPQLRQVALEGVRAFRLKRAIPQVEMLVADPNTAVAKTAISVLGDLRPRGTRGLLLGILGESGMLAWEASSVLAKLADREDMDIYVRRLAAKETLPEEKWLILDVLRRVTGEMSNWSFNRMRARGEPPSPKSIAEWKSWWGKNRRGSRADWFKGRLEVMVRDFISSNDRTRVWYARNLLRNYRPLASVGSERHITDKDRAIVRRWWSWNRNENAWDILSPNGYPDQRTATFLAELEPERSRRLLFRHFMRTANTSGARKESSLHRKLVVAAGVDFGDPMVASCGTRGKVASDWLAWARERGWAP